MGFKQIIFDHNLIMAIIAINITIIGLTSLAESKRIVGIDYGRFLIKKYRILSIFRIYPLLIIFGIINVSSLFLMFITTDIFRLYNFVLLVISLSFAIYYFFAYIITENIWVRRQIYKDEITGLYYDDANKNHQTADKLVEMNGGSRTGKRLSTNIVDFFNTYNGDSQQAFEELFGPGSVLYIISDYNKTSKWKLRRQNKYKKWMLKKYNVSPYLYRRSEQGIHDISYEFFQLFRYSELQDKWIIEILDIFDNKRMLHNKYDLVRLYNFARVITQLNLFGNNNNVYKYKFLEYLIQYYLPTVKILEDDKISEKYFDKILEIEIYTYRQLLQFMFEGSKNKTDILFQNKVHEIMVDFIVNHKYQGMLKQSQLIEKFLNETLSVGTFVMQNVFTDVLNDYYNSLPDENIPERVKEVNIRMIIESSKASHDKKQVNEVSDLF